MKSGATLALYLSMLYLLCQSYEVMIKEIIHRIVLKKVQTCLSKLIQQHFIMDFVSS